MNQVMLAISMGLLITGPSFASAWVDFDKGLITELDLHRSFPILSLGPPGKIPSHLLTEFITSVAPHTSLVRNDTLAAQFAYNDDQLIAYINETSGETKVYPNLVNVQPSNVAINISQAFNYVRLNEAFPLDHTNFFITTGSTLFGSTLHQSSKNNSSSNAHRYLTHAVVQRNVTSNGRSYVTCGAGSTASFGFTGDGRVRSLAYLWHPAKFTGHEVKPNSTDKIYTSIKDQLEQFGQQTGRVKVDSLDVCFYDSAVGFIQPVIRYRATLHSDTAGQSIAAPTPLLGYIPIGEGSPEPISTPESFPVDSMDAPSHPSHTNHKRAPRPDIKVGRYVVREDAWEFVTNAINFLKGLQRPFFFLPSPFAHFIDSQYYWAQPYMFITDKNNYINSVHLAQVEVHGNWHGFSTLHSGDDWVSLSAVPEEGYGGGAGGILAYWLIRSCSVIPSPDDYAPKDWRMAFDPWFRLFNGLHAVAGARTLYGSRIIPIPPSVVDSRLGRSSFSGGWRLWRTTPLMLVTQSIRTLANQLVRLRPLRCADISRIGSGRSKTSDDRLA